MPESELFTEVKNCEEAIQTPEIQPPSFQLAPAASVEAPELTNGNKVEEGPKPEAQNPETSEPCQRPLFSTTGDDEFLPAYETPTAEYELTTESEFVNGFSHHQRSQENEIVSQADPDAPYEPQAVPEPQLMLEPPTAAPLYKPVYTVEMPHLLTGITLEDDPHIQVTVPEVPPSRLRAWMSDGLLLGRDFFFAALVAAFIVYFIVQPVKVEGTSMLPRLHDGERIFINKFSYQFKMQSIQRGDIVVFWYPKDPEKSFIKRVIGLPGDEVQLIGGKLNINGKPVPEPYLSKDYTTIAAPTHSWKVEPHHYFVMGDNRDASNDSRSWGLVPEKYIYGKAIYRYWPFDEAGSLSDDVKELKDLKEQPPSNFE